MFKFGFNCEVEADCKDDELLNEVNKEKDADCSNEENTWYDSEQLTVESERVSNILGSLKHANMFVSNEIEIGYVNTDEIVRNKLSGDLIKAELNHSDLLSGVYEGGLKIWEGTQDLADFLTASQPDDLDADNFKKPGETVSRSLINSFKGKRVLDLGCGVGILGILALKFSAKVDFQDYNKDVLTDVTVTNIILNFEENASEIIDKSRLYSGDWSSFSDLTKEDDKYDIILTSETIYNIKNYEKLTKLFKTRLNANGVVYLAGKTYYFGVGGGLRTFEDYLKENTNFTSEVVWKHKDGVSRELLKITFKN